MSASPSANSGNTPNGGRPPPIRRSRVTDPLVRKPNRQRDRRPPPTGAPTGASQVRANGVSHQGTNKTQARPVQPPLQTNSNTNAKGNAVAEEPKPTKVVEYPLFTTKRALIEGYRHHIARFHSKKKIDLLSDQEFTRPVRLHRRDPRAPPAGAGAAKNEGAGIADSKEELMDARERERQDILRQEKEAQKQADLAQIAPGVNQVGGQNKRQPAFQKKTQQVYRTNETPQQQKESKLRYEEALPWHLEDFDNKNVWVGSYETALSEIHTALVVGQDSFHMVPIEKWYKFKPTNLFPTLSLEEAEALQKKRGKEPRWVMESQNADKVKQEEDRNRKMGSKLFIGKWEKGKAAQSGATNMKAEFEDADEIDFDDGADDDEGDGDLGGDEDEVKQAESRIKREQRAANFFDMNDEKDVDKEEEEEKKERERAKKLSKGVRKALVKREKNDDYDQSDSDRNPYSSESESDDTEEELRKEEERKKTEEKTEKPKPKDGNKPPSGASSKGTNTPSGRSKHSEPLKRTSSSLKRSGSPNLSEASGNESTRKKPKRKHMSSSSQPAGTSTPTPGTHQMSPVAPSSSAPESSSSRPKTTQRKSSIVKLPIEPSRLTEISSAPPRPEKAHKRQRGMSSDGDEVGGDTSEGGKKKKIKIRFSGSPSGGSPQSSRAGSPNPSQSQSQPQPQTQSQPADHRIVGAKDGNAAGKKTTAKQPPTTNPPDASKSGQLPTEAEIIAEIPPEGITVPGLVARFRGRNVDMASWKKLIAKTAAYGDDKLLRRKKT
ncbi:MAG: hypothetical protein M1837_007273 [Sclerophora amabilis]|nr:MAG: hypothetical protein M1837_007273 [Sclerophora amabilis]